MIRNTCLAPILYLSRPLSPWSLVFTPTAQIEPRRVAGLRLQHCVAPSYQRCQALYTPLAPLTPPVLIIFSNLFRYFAIYYLLPAPRSFALTPTFLWFTLLHFPLHFLHPPHLTTTSHLHHLPSSPHIHFQRYTPSHSPSRGRSSCCFYSPSLQQRGERQSTTDRMYSV